MAGHRYNVPLAAEVTVSTTTRTLMQFVAAATRRLWLLELSFSGKSIASTDIPFLAYLARQTTAGTSGSTITPRANNPDYPAALCTVNAGYTVEPTTTDIIAGPWRISPVGGLFVLQFPLGDEPEIKQGERAGLIVVTDQSTAIMGNVRVQE